MSLRAVHSYRRLLRSVQKAFGNDKYALKNARIELKKEFVKSKNVTNSSELDELYKGVEEVDEMLNFHLVQASLNQRGNYELKLNTEQLVTVEAGQDQPHGQALEVVDRSYLGEPVKIEKVKGQKSSKSIKFDQMEGGGCGNHH